MAINIVSPSSTQPLTAVSLVSVSVSPNETSMCKKSRCEPNRENLSSLRSTLHHAISTLSSVSTSPTYNDKTQPIRYSRSRENSKLSLSTASVSTSTLSTSHSNSNLCSLSPSLRSAYSIRRASSFRNFQKNRSLGTSYDDVLSEMNYQFSFTSHRSSITSICSLDCRENHPLFVQTPRSSSNEGISHELRPSDENKRNNSQSSCTLPPLPIPSQGEYEQVVSKKNQNTPTTAPSYAQQNSFNKEKRPDHSNSFISFLTKMNDSLNRSLESSYNMANKRPISPVIQEVPLETFSQKFDTLLTFHENIKIDGSDENILPICFFGKTKRIREHRVNPNYFLQYALNTSLLTGGLLQSFSEEEIDIFDDLLLEKYALISSDVNLSLTDSFFDDIFREKLSSRIQLLGEFKSIDSNFIHDLKLASIARYKIWSSVILQPRKDPVPSIKSIIQDVCPTASLETCQVPWLNIRDLKCGKAINKLKKPAGLLNNSNIQYVSKNCSSKRLVCHKHSNNI